MQKIPIVIPTEVQLKYFDPLISSKIWAAQAIADFMYETLSDLITPFQNIFFFKFTRWGFILDHNPNIEKVRIISSKASPDRAIMTNAFKSLKIDLF